VISTRHPIVASENSHAHRAIHGSRSPSRSLGESVRYVPAAPIPSSARLMIRYAKWCHAISDSTRVIDTCSTSPEADSRKIATIRTRLVMPRSSTQPPRRER
jgi:hypothetical protein